MSCKSKGKQCAHAQQGPSGVPTGAMNPTGQQQCPECAGWLRADGGCTKCEAGGHRSNGPDPDAAELREQARQHEQAAIDSFDRCDTDGFLSQWAHGINGQLARAKAEIAENGGKAQFPALLDGEGNRVDAKLINGRYGRVWILSEKEEE